MWEVSPLLRAGLCLCANVVQRSKDAGDGNLGYLRLANDRDIVGERQICGRGSLVEQENNARADSSSEMQRPGIVSDECLDKTHSRNELA